MDSLARHYNTWVLLRPWPLLIGLVAMLVFFGWQSRDFRLDASADSLLLENDRDLKVFRDLSDRYESKSFLVVALVPDQDIFVPGTLERVDRLAEDFEKVPGIASVVSLLDVPLLAQGEGSLTELVGGYRTLRDAEVDPEKARQELTTSPVFAELIVSADGRTTALQLNLDGAPQFDALQAERRMLTQRTRTSAASEAEKNPSHSGGVAIPAAKTPGGSTEARHHSGCSRCDGAPPRFGLSGAWWGVDDRRRHDHLYRQ